MDDFTDDAQPEGYGQEHQRVIATSEPNQVRWSGADISDSRDWHRRRRSCHPPAR